MDYSQLAHQFAVFKPLQNPDFLKQVEVADWEHSIQWPNEEGLDADRLLDMALKQAQRTDKLAVRNWQQKHHLSLTPQNSPIA